MKYVFLTLAALFFFTSTAYSADFGWLKELSIKAKDDLSGFTTKLEARFNVGDAQVRAVLSNVDSPEDAYMIFRMGELSDQPLDTVVDRYKKSKGKGWGIIAKELGIKPGSKEFKSLKRQHDLKYEEEKDKKNKQNKKEGRGDKGKKGRK